VGAPDGGEPDGTDCAHAVVASASANPASTAALETFQSALMTSPPAQFHSRSLEPGGPEPHSPAGWAASLHYLDASAYPFGNTPEEYFALMPESFLGMPAIAGSWRRICSPPGSNIRLHRIGQDERVRARKPGLNRSKGHGFSTETHLGDAFRR
jgi:hypothetical protein